MKTSYQIRKSAERKHFEYGWLSTYHTFSFGSYYDPQFMGFRDLRVINEDRVDPERGFPPHDHRDMEIISLVLKGELAHQDSAGGESVIAANEIQAMSAGVGITHSEFNPSNSQKVHFLQIWIIPNQKGLPPRYQKAKLPENQPNEWALVASPDASNGSLLIHQDVLIYSLFLSKGGKQQIKLGQERYGWIQVVSGEILLGEDRLMPGDGASIDAGTALALQAIIPSQLIFFDLK